MTYIFNLFHILNKSDNNNNHHDNTKKLLDNQRHSQNSAKLLRWSFLQKQLTVSGVSQGCEYASDKTKKNPGALPFVSQEIKTNLCRFLPLLNSILSSHYYLALRRYYSQFSSRVFDLKLIQPCS